MPKRKTEISDLGRSGGPAAQEAKKRLDAATEEVEEARPVGGSWLDGRGEPDGTGVMRRPGPDGETVEEPMQVWLGKGKAGTSTDWASHKEQLNALMEGKSTSYGTLPMAPESTPKPKSVALDTEEEEEEGEEEQEEEEEGETTVAVVWDAFMATLQGEFGEERLAKFSITHAKSEAVARLIKDSGQEQRMMRAAEAAFALVSCARARSGRGWSSSRLRESFNGFGVRGGTKAEFDAIKDAMLDGEPPLPTDVEAWVTKFCFILELSDGMRDLFDTPKARYESAMSLCQMENPDRASVALVVANAIANLVKDGEKVRGVDAANLSRYALDELTRFVNADGTEEEYRRVLIVVARMDLPEFDWHLYRKWVDVYATILRKLASYRAEELEIDVRTTTKLFVELMAHVELMLARTDQRGLLTVAQEDRLAKKVASVPSGAQNRFRVAGEVAIAIWANVRKGVEPDSGDADSLQILAEKVADLKAMKGTYKQVFDMANEGFMDGAEEKCPTYSEIELWTRWINRCDLGDGQTLAFPGALADRARELEGGKYLDVRERRWNVSELDGGDHQRLHRDRLAERWSRCCAESNPPPEGVWNEDMHRRGVPLPFIREPREDGKQVGKFPSVEMDNVMEKRTMRVQFEIMERRGAYGWLDQQFHPLCSFQGVMRAINVAQARVDSPLTGHADTARGPNRDAAQYKRKVHRMSECARAIEEDAPERFDCSAFSESLFKGEPEGKHRGCTSDGSLSEAFYRAVGFSLDTADHFGKGERRVEEWKDKVRQLARMRDVIATMMADAICEQLHKRVGRNVASEVYDAPPFSDEPLRLLQCSSTTAPRPSSSPRTG